MSAAHRIDPTAQPDGGGRSRGRLRHHRRRSAGLSAAV